MTTIDTNKPQDKPEEKPIEKIEKPDSEKTYEELKAEAEAAETRVKELEAAGDDKDKELRDNMIRRKEKAQEKLDKLAKPVTKAEDTIDTRDLIFLEKQDIAEGSEKANILEKYKAGGLIKSFKEGLDHPGVKAEFAVIDAKNNAHAVIDENDTDEGQMKTRKEILQGYKTRGEVPTDPKLQEELAKDNLKEMGL